MSIIVFDLDMTIIDSGHRHMSKPDGSADLEHWFDNATPEKIAADKLLPLARTVRRFYDAGHVVVFCTARCMQEADHAFLAAHADDLPHHYLFSRPGRFVAKDSPEYADSYFGFIGDGRDDGEIKLEQINALVADLGYRDFDHANVILFEDNINTINLFQKNYALCFDATRANKNMMRGAM